MTKEEIVKAAGSEFGFPSADLEVIEFALAMVQLHNEECAKVVEGDDNEQYYQDSLRSFLAMKIRGAKP